MYTHASIIDSQFLRYFTVIVEGLVDNIGSNKYKVAPTKPIQGQTIYRYTVIFLQYCIPVGNFQHLPTLIHSWLPLSLLVENRLQEKELTERQNSQNSYHCMQLSLTSCDLSINMAEGMCPVSYSAKLPSLLISKPGIYWSQVRKGADSTMYVVE